MKQTDVPYTNKGIYTRNLAAQLEQLFLHRGDQPRARLFVLSEARQVREGDEVRILPHVRYSLISTPSSGEPTRISHVFTPEPYRVGLAEADSFCAELTRDLLEDIAQGVKRTYESNGVYRDQLTVSGSVASQGSAGALLDIEFRACTQSAA